MICIGLRPHLKDGGQMAKLSVCMVVHNEEKLLPSLLKYLKPIVDEFLIFDQDSTDRTPRILADAGAHVVHRTRKSLADIDRQDCYTLATGDLVLALDPDEKPDKRLMKYLITLKQEESAYDVWWFKFRNLVDGIDIEEVMPSDWHPRLWKRADNRQPCIIWPGEAHTHPQVNTPRQLFFGGGGIDHIRTLAKIKAVHEDRGKVIDPRNRQFETGFQQMLEDFLSRKKGTKGRRS